MTNTKRPVGWIGLGQMGRAMAARVVKARHAVRAHVRSLENRETARAAGIELTRDMAEAVKDSDFIGVALYDDAQLRDALLGPEGALRYLKPGAVMAIHTTGGLNALSDIAAQTPAGAYILDATFSGAAQTLDAGGHITLMAGGEPEALARALPVLECYCNPITLVGGLGAARKLKLLNNLLFAGQVSLAVHTLRLAEQLGLDPLIAAKVLQSSSGGSFAMGLAGQDWPPDDSLNRLGRYLDKDCDAARDAAAELRLDLGLLGDVSRQWGKQR